VAVGVRPLASSALHVSAYEVCELLYKFPGVPRTSSGEPLLDDLDGFDGQREVGGDGEYLFIDGGAARVRGKGALRRPARSHAFTLSVGETGEMGVKRAWISFFVPRVAVFLAVCSG